MPINAVVFPPLGLSRKNLHSPSYAAITAIAALGDGSL